MDSQLPSYITLLGFLLPATVFIARLKTRTLGHIVHALLMAVLCLFVGLAISGATISLFDLSNALLSSAVVALGSLVAMASRLIWIKRFA